MQTTIEHKIFIKDQVRLEYRIVRRSKRRGLTLLMHENAQLEVRSPKRLALFKIEEMIHQKLDWILEKQEAMNQKIKFIQINEESNIPYLGKNYALQLKYSYSTHPQIFVLNDQIHLYLKDRETFAKEGKKKLLQWYKEKSQEIIKEKIDFYSQILNVKIKSFSIRNQKKRWGSCSSKARLNFNWRLILLEEEIIDYVVVHEICHILHLNHSKLFWDKVKSVLPHYLMSQKKLKQKSTEVFYFSSLLLS